MEYGEGMYQDLEIDNERKNEQGTTGKSKLTKAPTESSQKEIFSKSSGVDMVPKDRSCNARRKKRRTSQKY